MSKTAKDQLQQIATAAGTSYKELRTLVIQDNIDEENFVKRMVTAKQNQVQDMQLNLMRVQLHNEQMKEIILSGKLKRKVWRETKYQQFKSFFNGLAKRKAKDQPDSKG